MPSRMKDRIAETLFDILKEKPFDKITVKEVVEVCDVTRQTFYYHFDDLLDVLEWSMRKHVKEMGSACLNEEDPIRALRIFIDHTFETRPAMEKLLESQHRAAIERMMMESIREFLQARVALDADAASWDDTAVVLDFYTFGIVGTLLSASMREGVDPGRLAQQMYQLLYRK